MLFSWMFQFSVVVVVNNVITWLENKNSVENENGRENEIEIELIFFLFCFWLINILYK